MVGVLGLAMAIRHLLQGEGPKTLCGLASDPSPEWPEPAEICAECQDLSLQQAADTFKFIDQTALLEERGIKKAAKKRAKKAVAK